MDNGLRNRLLKIASGGLIISGLIFLCLSIFIEPQNSTYLCVALFCSLLANLFQIIRSLDKKNEDKR